MRAWTAKRGCGSGTETGLDRASTRGDDDGAEPARFRTFVPFLPFCRAAAHAADAWDAAGSAASRSSRSMSLTRWSISGMNSGSSRVAVPT